MVEETKAYLITYRAVERYVWRTRTIVAILTADEHKRMVRSVGRLNEGKITPMSDIPVGQGIVAARKAIK